VLVTVLLTPALEQWTGAPLYVVGLGIFLLAAITDMLDGRLARRWNQVTKLGTLLDTTADKLLIAAALIALVENHAAPAWAVVIIVGREIAITGLRSIAATEGIVISAGSAGKFKMVMQVIAVGFLILSLSPTGEPPILSNFGRPFPAIQFWAVPELRDACASLWHTWKANWNNVQIFSYTAGRASLWIVVIASMWSMWGYARDFYKKTTAF